MPKWIHDRADHLEKKNPSMPKSRAFAIATQQAYAAKKAPKDYGTSEGKSEAHKKYNKSAGNYEQAADPKEKTSMAKLAGHMPLADMISQAIEGARAKMASANSPAAEETDIVEETEKVASAEVDVIDVHNPAEIEKLASALEFLGEKLADSVYNGEESKQGGDQLPTNTQVGGKQPYDKSKAKHQPPAKTGTKAGGDNGKSPTLMQNDQGSAPGMHSPYPKSGVLKTSAAKSVMDQIRAAAEEKAETKVEEKAEKIEKTEAKPEEKTAADKKDSAVDFLLGKLASTRFSGESRQGGETLDSAAEEGPKPPTAGSNSARGALKSNAGPAALTKLKAKSIQKPQLAQVLTEPAMSKSTDNKVHENLRNATKGGVKIAAATARAYLAKIKEAGCACDGKGECKYCKMKTAMSKSKN